MSNQTVEPKNNTPRFNLTTKSLGIADVNTKDLGGFMLNQSDLSTAIMKILLSVGINEDDIRSIKVGCDSDRKLKLFAEVRKKALKGKKNDREDNDWTSFDDYSDDDGKVFSKEFFNTLKNKVYYKHLEYKTFTRTVNKKGKKEKFVQIEFDPEILIAFVYNLNYEDPYLKISCTPVKWLNDKELGRKYDSNKKQNSYKAMRREYLAEKLSICTVIVTFAIDKRRKINLYESMVDKFASIIPTTAGVDKETIKRQIRDRYTSNDFLRDFDNTLTSGEFHPNQVVNFNGGSIDEYHDKKRHKK